MEDFEVIKAKVKRNEATRPQRKWYYFNTLTVIAVMLLAGGLLVYMVTQNN